MASNAGYDILVAFKAARQSVLRPIINKVIAVNTITMRQAVRREVSMSPRKPATINREMEVVRRLCVYAHRRGWLARIPSLPVRR